MLVVCRLLILVQGLVVIYEVGFIYFDIKFVNILVMFDGYFKIVDFGMVIMSFVLLGIEGEGDCEYIGLEIFCG